MASREDFVRIDYLDTSEWRMVRDIADLISLHLDDTEVAGRLAGANLPGLSSAGVQEVFLAHARELGFRNESKGLFLQYQSALRPDYYLQLGETGIILEVERGKSTINNMDMLDFWKCHICEHAHYLFLMVPMELRQNARMAPRREFTAVRRRLEPFFRPHNYTNVRGLVLFGY